MEYYYTQYSSPIGELTIASNGGAIVALWLDTQTPKISMQMQSGNNLPIIQETCRWLDAYFTGQNPDIKILALSPQGTPFQQEVWDILKNIPYGQTITYGQIASMIAQHHGAKKMSAQAVGQAVGANPISIIIPCHRVLGANGKLTGYDGGIDKKQMLLRHEGICI